MAGNDLLPLSKVSERGHFRKVYFSEEAEQGASLMTSILAVRQYAERQTPIAKR